MKNLIVLTLISFFLTTAAFSQSFSRVDSQQQNGKNFIVTSSVSVEDNKLSLDLQFVDEASQDILWNQNKKWPITYQETGYVFGENSRAGATALTLIYTPAKIDQFATEFENDTLLQNSYDEASQYNNTACKKGFRNYEAIVLETNRTVSTIIQAICY
jgi:hypothetical protein